MASLAVALLAGIGAAQACEGDKVLFEDDFATLEPTWGAKSEEVDVAGNKLMLTPEANYTTWVPSTANLYEDIDFCADVSSVKAVDPDHSYAGLVFWYADDDNFYAFEFAANGNASVWRRQRGKWLKQMNWQPAGALKQNDGAVNQLRVVTMGNEADFYINGSQFGSIKGVPPADGQQIGVIASSPKDAVATYSVANLKVTEPSKDQSGNTQQQ
ncbi:MAG TPA: hypothetical protein VFB16_06960 [Bauldia sp.]|nr:hypothetical protein [Bauldia sp.]